MLLKLEKYGVDKGYFTKKKLKDFSEAKKDGFDSLEKEVIDFDETGKFFKTYNHKTGDALIFDSKDKLKFIEFKALENNNNISDFIESLDFSLKVQESFSILRLIVNEKDFGSKINRNGFNETKNNFIFSINCKKIDSKLEIFLSMHILGFEDYDKTLEKVFWIETKDIKKYL